MVTTGRAADVKFRRPGGVYGLGTWARPDCGRLRRYLDGHRDRAQLSLTHNPLSAHRAAILCVLSSRPALPVSGRHAANDLRKSGYPLMSPAPATPSPVGTCPDLGSRVLARASTSIVRTG